MGLGSILKTLRKSYKYSQKQVANGLKISRNAYMAWENGETKINLKKLNQICELYQISLQDLLINVEKKKASTQIKRRSLKKKHYLSTSLEMTNF